MTARAPDFRPPGSPRASTPPDSPTAPGGARADEHAPRATGAFAVAPSEVLAVERDRAERALNVVRILVLILLAVAALLYAPSLTPALNRTNVVILLPTLAWAIVQIPLFHRRRRLPPWLGVINPVLDITAVSCIIGGYALASTPMLALKTPIITAYFVILAALPVASSVRKAAIVSALAVAEYAALVVGFALSGDLSLVASPVLALGSDGVSPLDEGARLFLLACAGGVATYATHWHERVWRR
ncbi:MAG TPA: hypothetical protein VFV33_11515, partial [Gemmatimonadaceae bacterium]|nr:hypothetical protein [Gemmatimonadaceae bacterium]